jgi:hypothetical protein
MPINSDSKELMSAYATSIIEGYKIFLACLLSIFVPQHCPETKQTCTLKENFMNLSTFNEFVLVYNFLTLGLFLYLYWLQNRRETYLITHLDADKKHAITSFQSNCEGYPKILNKVLYYNRWLHTCLKITAVFFITNVLFSAILVGYYYYDGFRTTTTLIANVLLVSSKIYSLYGIMVECNNPSVPLALSTYQLTPVGYNVIDADYVTDSIHRNSTTTRSEIQFTTVIKE